MLPHTDAGDGGDDQDVIQAELAGGDDHLWGFADALLIEKESMRGGRFEIVDANALVREQREQSEIQSESKRRSYP